MKKASISLSGTLLKIIIGTGVLLVLGTVILLSREIQPTTHMVTKTLDSSQFKEKTE